MDFITKLPRTANGHDTIWVIVDRLTKSAHFIPICETFTSERLAEVFINEVAAWHGMPLTIVSDRDTRFTSRIMARVGEVAYRLELPDELSGIHPTFHIVRDVVGLSIRTTKVAYQCLKFGTCHPCDAVLEVWCVSSLLRQVMMMDGDAGRLDELPG
ncbi:hypothetical protein L1987_57946 [Smallanthus sonchifolius]|uniref:Uncharacterized protein n=1 Tax=Smallanthus sonchifolius TaxID=185202 RepID=A0ACB9DEK6_9ASTR|nr:hypothetical protein L1987_57946 [Smallanthus sonchifolius]